MLLTKMFFFLSKGSEVLATRNWKSLFSTVSHPRLTTHLQKTCTIVYLTINIILLTKTTISDIKKYKSNAYCFPRYILPIILSDLLCLCFGTGEMAV